MEIKTFGRGLTAVKLIALTSVLAASCALPGYEIGKDAGSGSTSGGGSDTSTASAGGGQGGAGGDVSTTTGGGMNTGGVNTGGMGAGGTHECPDPNSNPANSQCDLPSGTSCEFVLPCCTVKGACQEGTWKIPTTCGPGCPNLAASDQCKCSAEDANTVCFSDSECTPKGEGAVTKTFCSNQTWKTETFDCCDSNGSCQNPDVSTCFHMEIPMGVVSLCKPNPCLPSTDCTCVNSEKLCFNDLTCAFASNTEIKCTKP